MPGLSDVLLLAGLAAVVVAMFLVALWLGLLVGGLSLVGLSFAFADGRRSWRS